MRGRSAARRCTAGVSQLLARVHRDSATHGFVFSSFIQSPFVAPKIQDGAPLDGLSAVPTGLPLLAHRRSAIAGYRVSELPRNFQSAAVVWFRLSSPVSSEKNNEGPAADEGLDIGVEKTKPPSDG
jgi:hypothetical protein